MPRTKCRCVIETPGGQYADPECVICAGTGYPVLKGALSYIDMLEEQLQEEEDATRG